MHAQRRRLAPPGPKAGIRHVFDLRSETEAADFPDRLPAGADYVRLSMTSDQTFQARTIYERIVDGEIKSYGEDDMVTGYLRMLENFGPSLARIARQVGQGEPTVIHCTAGKDRTGVASMLLLDLAGVAAENVVADYALSSERRPSLQKDQTEARSLIPMLEDYGLDPAEFAPLWEARPAVMSATLDQPARPLGRSGLLPCRRGHGGLGTGGRPSLPARPDTPGIDAVVSINYCLFLTEPPGWLRPALPRASIPATVVVCARWEAAPVANPSVVTRARTTA